MGSVERKHQQRGEGRVKEGRKGGKGRREDLRIRGGGDSSDQHLLQIQQLQLLRLKEHFAEVAADSPLQQLHSDLRVQIRSNYLHAQTQQEVVFKNS